MILTKLILFLASTTNMFLKKSSTSALIYFSFYFLETTLLTMNWGVHLRRISAFISWPRLNNFYLWRGTLRRAWNRKELLKPTDLQISHNRSCWWSQEPCISTYHSGSSHLCLQYCGQTRNLRFYIGYHIPHWTYWSFWAGCFPIWYLCE